jgi:hypothetical protein
VTIDATGCQTKIAGQTADGGGTYVLAVKENQPTLHQRIKRNVKELLLLTKFAGVRHGHARAVDGDHGRAQTRDVWVSDELDRLGEEKGRWPGLRSVAVVESTRDVPIEGVGTASGGTTSAAAPGPTPA